MQRPSSFMLLASFIATSAATGCAAGGASALPMSAPLPLGAASAPGSPGSDASPVRAAASVSFSVVDYFSGRPVSATIAVDRIAGPPAHAITIGLTAGLHQVQISAPNYATFNGAVQLPGGQPARTIALFPVSAAQRNWLARVDADRAANGAGPVELDDMLTIAAFDHAVDMGVQRYFAHFDPNGFAPTTRSLLLGSEVMGDENIAAGFASWSTAQDAFMAERSALAHATAADCAAADERAGHYCNIVYRDHNWVGLAIANVPGSPEMLYYDQEFGDLYGMVDTTVINREPALGGGTSLIMAALDATLQEAGIATLSPPVPISIATLNADPRCLSRCPAADQWYPTAATVFSAPQTPVDATFAQSMLYYPQAYTSVPAFAGSSAATIYWPGGTVVPQTYHSAAFNVEAQSIRRAAPPSPGVQARAIPNGTEMQARTQVPAIAVNRY